VFRLRSALVLIGGLALLAPACSSDGTQELNLGKAESEIRNLSDRMYGTEADVGAVTCPERVFYDRGSLFTCTIAIDGQPLLFGVRQTDDQGNVRIEPAQTVVFTKKAEALVATYAAGQGTPTTAVSCGEDSLATRSPGEYFSCTVTFADGTSGVARLQVKNTAGDVGLQDLK
jgi:hypothetical protein